MGGNHSSHKSISYDADAEVTLDHFQILRAIGKGSFGKVCIVQKKDTKKMFAMKYMNKAMCVEKDAVKNVMQEVELLMRLDHPFLVNLWFTFQDSEDMFMVVDLLLGGDLRYHIQHDLKFDEARVQLYICEIALALDYLRSQNVLHRDIKPDNMLLDEEDAKHYQHGGGDSSLAYKMYKTFICDFVKNNSAIEIQFLKGSYNIEQWQLQFESEYSHVHITDFNVALILEEKSMATTMSGTKPYMAPEVFACALEECPGYHYPADWWSLGVCAFEMLRGRRPYDIQCNSSCIEVKQLFATTYVSYPSYWDDDMCSLLNQLLTLDPTQRLCSSKELQRHSYVKSIDFKAVLSRQIKPVFIPSKDHLNCDPTYELEEMIIEAKPLHKKKKRLAKQNSKRQKSTSQGSLNNIDTAWVENLEQDFHPYNRQRDFVRPSAASTQAGTGSSTETKETESEHKTKETQSEHKTKLTGSATKTKETGSETKITKNNLVVTTTSSTKEQSQADTTAVTDDSSHQQNSINSS